VGEQIAKMCTSRGEQKWVNASRREIKK